MLNTVLYPLEYAVAWSSARMCAIFSNVRG